MVKRSLVFLSVLLLGLFLSGCKSKKVTVEFHLNGGVGNIEKQVLKKNETAVKPEDPSRDGYDFAGWFLNEEEFSFSTKVTKNITLVANWDEVSQTENVNITFDVNGGEPTVVVQIILKGSKAIKPDDPTKENHNFLGWYIDDLLFDFDDVVNNDLTLVAKWEKIPGVEYTVTFDADGGVTNLTETLVGKGNTATKPNDPIRGEDVFLHWKDQDGNIFSFTSPVYKDYSLIAIYEVEQIETIEVTYFSEGDEPVVVTINKGEIPENLLVFEKEGYTFKGYKINNEFYLFDTPLNEDTTLVATWEEIIPENPIVKVTLDGNGGTIIFNTYNFPKGGKMPVPIEPTRIDYKFIGWHLDGELFDFDTNVEEDITLVAQWQEIVYVYITFDSDGGTPTPETIKLPQGSKATRPDSPTKEGYRFLGWYSSNRPFNFGSSIIKDVNLVARWEEIITEVVVTFDTNGGTIMSPITMFKGEKVVKPADPTKENYTFIEWQLDGVAFDFNKTIEEDITLIAIWEAVIQAYIGEVGYVSAFEAGENLNDGETLSLTKDYDGSELNIYADDVLITKYKNHHVVVKEEIYIYSENVEITHLTFTNYAKINIENSIESFRFENNKVHDLSYTDNKDFNLNRRANVNAFIYAYNDDNYTIKDVVLRNNEFLNINITVILLSFDSFTESFFALENTFTNIKHSAIRIDSNLNGGSIYIEDNDFKNITHNAIFINGIGNEVDNKPFQTVNINRNSFYKVSQSTLKPDKTKLNKATIIIYDNNHEIPLNLTSEYNHFYLTSIAYYIDNAIKEGTNPVMKLNNNNFDFIQGYAIQQRHEANYVDTVDVDFTKNTYQTYVYDNILQHEITISNLCANNYTYVPYYADETLIYENEYVNHDVTIYVNSELDNDHGDTINVLNKEFFYGHTAFSSIEDALAKANSTSVIYLDPQGYYPEDFTVGVAGVTIISNNAGVPYNDSNFKINTAIIEGKVTVRANNVTFDGLRFTGNSSIVINHYSGDTNGFKFLNNYISNQLADADTSKGFIEAFYKTTHIVVKNVYITGNTFKSTTKFTPFIGENIENLYVLNNNFEGNFDNDNNAIVLRGTEGELKGPGTKGRIFIYRNKFENFNKDVILVDYYGTMNLKVKHNEFIGVKKTGVLVYNAVENNQENVYVRVSNNTFSFSGGSAAAVDLVYQNYPTTLSFNYNYFLTEPRFYLKNSGNTEFVNADNNKYNSNVSNTHFINVDSFTKITTLPPYYGFIED